MSTLEYTTLDETVTCKIIYFNIKNGKIRTWLNSSVYVIWFYFAQNCGPKAKLQSTIWGKKGKKKPSMTRNEAKITTIDIRETRPNCEAGKQRRKYKARSPIMGFCCWSTPHKYGIGLQMYLLMRARGWVSLALFLNCLPCILPLHGGSNLIFRLHMGRDCANFRLCCSLQTDKWSTSHISKAFVYEI